MTTKMTDEIKDLMEKYFLITKDLHYGCYTGQARRARELAIKKFGIEKVALMSDTDIEKAFRNEGLIPMEISYCNGCDCEMVYLVPIQILDTLEVLSR